jgi:hypothetical protein
MPHNQSEAILAFLCFNDNSLNQADFCDLYKIILALF